MAALVFYLLSVTFIFLPNFILGSDTFSTYALLMCYLIFIALLIASLMNLVNFYKAIGKADNSAETIMYLVLGISLFIIAYFYFRRKMTEEMRSLN